MMKLKFYKIRPAAKMPVRAHSTDAGLDLFYCPNPDPESDCYWRPEGVYKIPPGASCLVPTGLRVEVPTEHMLEIKNKSGIAHKKKLIVGACVVDPGYTGEVYINLHNIGGSTRTIEPGQKIAQAVLVPIVSCQIEEVWDDPSEVETDRGAGGFGSTGLI
jgi:dUTP pyrophosphatase